MNILNLVEHSLVIDRQLVTTLRIKGLRNIYLVIRFLSWRLHLCAILIRFGAYDVFGSLLHFIQIFSAAIKFSHADEVHGVDEESMLNLEIDWGITCQ